ncbi:MAG: glycosyl hydrolase family 88 [Paenibacillaceae bacterium]|nr:glycosyl hydrolase family 88 [Paenibacillaceae bacterium]
MEHLLKHPAAQWAGSYMERYYQSESRPGFSYSWNYENGIFLYALYRIFRETGDPAWLDCIRKQVDQLVEEDGSIRTYVLEDYNLDQIQMGRVLFPLYDATGLEKYKLAIERLARQLKGQPRTEDGSFWHKKVYPFQVWLDGLYMAMPFRCDYAVWSGQSGIFDDVCFQLLQIEKCARDKASGLLYHGWDESREERWSSPASGCSPNFWSRSMGWYLMALVDVLEILPEDHASRGQLIGIMHRLVLSLARYQDQATGLWYQVTDRGREPGNYLEASGTAMFVYAIAKGVRMKYLSSSCAEIAAAGFTGLLDHAAHYDDEAVFHLGRINRVAGLGGTPYRDGSYEYYTGEPVVEDDPKGVAPLLLAALEPGLS